MEGKDLRIVFMGTPGFATESLKALVENNYQVVGVVTTPDKPAGRGQQISESEVKKYAVANDLVVLQPEKLKDEAFLDRLKKLNADLNIVVAFRMLPEAVWSMPKYGTFNLHASLLPDYRGAAPLNWAIINGETKTGVTTFLIDHEIDTGKVLFKEEIVIEDSDTVGHIHDKLMHVGARLVLKTVDALALGNVRPVDQDKLLQDDRKVKLAPKIFKEDCKIDWKKDVETVRNLVRGLSPYPGAWTNFVHVENGKIIAAKIFYGEKTSDNTNQPVGSIQSDGKSYLRISCKDGWLSVTDIQLSGKRRMKVDELLRGFQNIQSYKAE